MTLPPLLTLHYWFNPSPPPYLPWLEWALLGFFVLLAVSGLAVHAWRNGMKQDKLMRRAVGRAGSALITLGLMGLFLYLLYFERIYFLSMRFFYLLWLGCALWWGWLIYRQMAVTIPAQRKKQVEREQFEKWLPKKK